MKKLNKQKISKSHISSPKSHHSGITLIALVVTIVVLLILAGVTITLMFGKNNIFDFAKDAADKTNTAIEDEKMKVEGLDSYIKDKAGVTGGNSGEDPDVPPTPETPKSPTTTEEDIEGVTFSTAYGKIDVIWLDGITNNPSSTQSPNSPANYLNRMTPIKWNGTTETPATVTDTDWYNYEQATGTQDSKTSHWANAKTTNGSYFVWIPRYAYRITYYDKDPNTDNTAQITGYYDGYGMWRASDGALKCRLETDDSGKTIIETIPNYNDKSYIVHPAFTTNLDMGGWTSDLPGFWIAKFEISGDESSTTSLKSTPNSNSFVSKIIGRFYTVARNATYGMAGTTDTDGNNSFMYSHMEKNSEWGAVAYLTHSKYGRNGNEIGFNTGNEAKSAIITSVEQSTTGNAYGVYDIRGGASEYTASFDKNNTDSFNGNSFTSTKTSTKYATAYKNETTKYSGSPEIYNICKTGDGIKEVYASGANSWFLDYANFVYSSTPFFVRGGNYVSSETGSGVFCSGSSGGGGSHVNGFRTVLCP